MASDAAMAVYWLADEQKVTVIRGDFWQEKTLESCLESGKEAFILAPFITKQKSFVLENIFTLNFELDDLPHALIEDSSNLMMIELSEKKEHIELVEKAIGIIKSRNFGKIVVSRNKEKSIEVGSLDVASSFLNLIFAYPNSFVSLVKLSKDEIWLGATPEKLIIKDDKKNVTLMALAGTKLADSEENWTEKEVNEQKLVADYIFDISKKYLKGVKVSETSTVKAGTVSHLLTTMTGKLEAEAYFAPLTNALHPTPAVCGFPKNEALKFIAQYEGYDRSFYSGYLGILNRERNHELFVNLRTVKIEPKKITFYAGGGVNSLSDPEKEWNEVVNKMNVVARALIVNS
jgi:isochorismate synthase